MEKSSSIFSFEENSIFKIFKRNSLFQNARMNGMNYSFPGINPISIKRRLTSCYLLFCCQLFVWLAITVSLPPSLSLSLSLSLSISLSLSPSLSLSLSLSLFLSLKELQENPCPSGKGSTVWIQYPSSSVLPHTSTA